MDGGKASNKEQSRPDWLVPPKWLQRIWWRVATSWAVLLYLVMVAYPFLTGRRYDPSWQELLIMVLPILPLLLLIFAPTKVGPFAMREHEIAPETRGKPFQETPAVAPPPEPLVVTNSTAAPTNPQTSPRSEVEKAALDEIQGLLSRFELLKAVQIGQVAIETHFNENSTIRDIATSVGFAYGEGGDQQNFLAAIFFSKLAMLGSPLNISARMNQGLALYHATFGDLKQDFLQDALTQMRAVTQILGARKEAALVLERGKSKYFTGLILVRMDQNATAKTEIRSAIIDLESLESDSSYGPIARKWLGDARQHLNTL